jgi:hypothetical protein
MANYTKTTDFAAKDTLPGGDTNKVVRGSEFETEFDAISTAIATKSDTAGPTFTGTVTIPTVDINAGAIDGTVIGASSAAAGTFTNLVATSADINGGTVDGATIGGSSAGAGTFTNLTASGTVNFNGATVSNLGTITTANLDGGTADNIVIGGATPAAGSFTTLSISSTFTLGGDSVTSTAAELNILDGITASTAELNILDGKSFVDEDDLSSNSATGIPSQQSVKAYVDSQTGGGGATLAGLADTNVTSPADAALLFYDTGTSKWIDNAVSGDITIADTGVAAIGSGVIVNADINASAAIAISKLDGVTSTASEINLTDGSSAGTIVNSKAVIYGSSGEVNATTLQIAGSSITSTAAELNILDGVTATATELNILDGVTSTTSELNILDGVTSTASELNILDGVTATTSELNILDGVTSTATEINLLDGVTATTTEINYLDVTTLGTSEASKVVTADANGVVTFDNGKIEESTAVSSSSNAATINLRDGDNFTHTLSENVTYTFSNPASSGKVSAFTLTVTQDSSPRTITWPGAVKWSGGTTPTLSTGSGDVDVFVFFTNDGGTKYYGFTAGQDMS